MCGKEGNIPSLVIFAVQVMMGSWNIGVLLNPGSKAEAHAAGKKVS